MVGFSYLEPKRHVPHVTDLEGAEARTLGEVLSRTTRALRETADADVVYLYVFGEGIPHLHFHLVPHRAGDALNDHMIRGELIETPLPSGATRIESREFLPLPKSRHERFLRQIRRALATPASSRGTPSPPRAGTGRPRPAR